MENEVMITNGEKLPFSEIMQKIGGVTYVLDDSQIIANTTVKGIKILFLSENVQLEINDFKATFAYDEFSRISLVDSKTKDESGEPIWNLFFDKQKVSSFDDDDASKVNEMLKKLRSAFTDKVTCTPKYEVMQKVEEFSINASGAYNKELYELLLQYADKFEEITDDDLLEPNSKILQILEEHSGKIVGNIGDTLKKNFSLKGLLDNGIGGIVSTAITLGTAAGDRTSADMLASEKNLIILTDKNVIFALKTELEAYSFDDALMTLTARDDEVLANVVDIYNDEDEKILEDIAKNAWISFRRGLKKLKKEAEEMPAFERSMPQPEMIASPMQNLMTGQTNTVAALTCDKCGAQSPVGTKFCLNCGDPFILCPACGQDNPSETKFCVFCGSPMKLVCKNCGAGYIAGARFCGECGQKL